MVRAGKWAAVLAVVASVAAWGGVSLIARESKQPGSDTKPGDTTGDGFLNGAWHIAKP